jgi:hypothetical protein
MSSSDARSPGKPFAFGFLAVLLPVLALVGVGLLVVDPLGILGGNAICGAGAKSVLARPVKPIIAARARPRTVVIGTSRVAYGFDHEALARLGPPPAVNLGVEGAMIADYRPLLAQAMAGGKVERVYLGIDPNSLAGEGFAADVPFFADSWWPAGALILHGFFSREAVIGLARSIGDCRPHFDEHGAPVHAEDLRHFELLGPRPSVAQLERRFVRERVALERGDEHRRQARLAELRSLLRELRRRGIETVVFTAPQREDVLAAHARAGLAPVLQSWFEMTATLARAEGAAFVDMSSAPAVAALKLPPCPSGSIACHFPDRSHFSPVIGRAMARLLAAEMEAAQQLAPSPARR